jgi:hypothetical protein
MSWGVFSIEDFPKWDEENGCMADYKQALGVQVVLKAGTWVKLEDFYRHVRYESWIDAAGDGRESVTTGKEVAERLMGDFRSVGIVAANLDKMTDAEREKTESFAKENNLKHKRRFVDRFEQQFRTKMQGGPGRWLPNQYEQDCYKALGLKPPDTVQKLETENRAQAPVIIEQKIDSEYLQQLITAEVEKRMQEATAPKR